ncbi:MAG: hypothetical protein KDB90_17155 [Planctomycetes bacterium]|nr:hypothetical protein [Planctomycetota bacterium]
MTDIEEQSAQAPSRGVPETTLPESGTLRESSAHSGRTFARNNPERAISREALERVAAQLIEREARTLVALWEHWKGHGIFIASENQIRAISGYGHKAHWSAINGLLDKGLIRRVQSGRSRQAFDKLKGRPRRKLASKWAFEYEMFDVKWVFDKDSGQALPSRIKQANDHARRERRRANPAKELGFLPRYSSLDHQDGPPGSSAFSTLTG